MTGDLVALPMLLPLLVGFLLLPLRDRPRLQRALCGGVMIAILIFVIYQAVWVRHHGILVKEVGNWPAPFGITLVVDLFPALLMVMTMVTGTLCLFYAYRTIRPSQERYYFWSLYLLITGSINGAFMTGDIFNLFVFFELILMSSYLLLTVGSRQIQLRESFKFLLMNALSAAFLLLGVGLLYGMTGTLNMADLAQKLATHPDPQLVTLVSMVFLFAFGVKAAIVPLFFWLPKTYAAAPTAVTAYLGEVGTKVGVYALYRVFTLLFIGNIAFTHHLIMWVAAATMLIGVLGAVAQLDFKRLLAFHIVSQIGYMIFGLSLMTVKGLTGGIIHIVHHMAAKPALFLLSGATEEATGTTSLNKMKGMLKHAPLLGYTFFIGGLSLTGVPPTSGFFSKFYLFTAGFGDGYWIPTATAVFVSLLTLFSMMKIFRLVYWGKPMELPWPMQQGFYGKYLLPGAGLVAVGLLMGFGATWLVDLTSHAAATLLQPELYIEAVLGETPIVEFAGRGAR